MEIERPGALVARNGGRGGLVALVAILLLGLGLRIDYAWVGRSPVFDATAYARIAANLERDRGFTLGAAGTQPATNYSPGLPLLVGGLYKLSGGPNVRFARLVLAVVGWLSVLFAYLIGRRLSGPLAGLIGAAAVAVYPAFLEYHGMLMTEPLAAALLSGSLLAILWASDPEQEGSIAAWLLPGVLLGATAMVRPEYLAVAFVLAAVVFGRIAYRGAWRPALARTAVLLLGLVLIVAPWTVRNAVALGRFVPISTGGGQVLFAGSYLPSGGDPERVGAELLERHPGLTRQLAGEFGTAPSVESVLHRVRLEQILAAFAADRFPNLETDRALTRMGREQLLEDITDDPLGYIRFVGAKISRIWWHGARGVMRRPGWEALHWALLVFGLIGLGALAWRRRWEAVLLIALVLSVTGIGALLVASPRRALVMIPLAAATAGVGATACVDSLARRWQR